MAPLSNAPVPLREIKQIQSVQGHAMYMTTNINTSSLLLKYCVGDHVGSPARPGLAWLGLASLHAQWPHFPSKIR